METVKLVSKKIDIFMEYFSKYLVILAQIMVGIMVVVITVQVYYRFVLNSSIRWSQEVPRMAMAWFSAIAIAYGVKEKLHISIELLALVTSPKIKKINNIVIDVLILLTGIVLLVFGIVLCEGTTKQTLPTLQWPKTVFYILMPISSIVIIYYSARSLVAQIIERSGFLKWLGLGPIEGHKNWGEAHDN